MRKKAYGKIVENSKTKEKTWKAVTKSLKYKPKSSEEISFE
jgi:hypothetical protein